MLKWAVSSVSQASQEWAWVGTDELCHVRLASGGKDAGHSGVEGEIGSGAQWTVRMEKMSLNTELDVGIVKTGLRWTYM